MFTCPASLFLEPQMRAIEQVGFCALTSITTQTLTSYIDIFTVFSGDAIT